MSESNYLDDLANQYGGTSTAAPAGLNQTGQAQAGYAQQVPGYENSTLGALAEQYGPTQANQSWYTGVNLAEGKNGWDNDFREQFLSGFDEAAKAGTLATYFESPDATGVVLWDHESKDGRQSFTFGDIYQGGKKVGNVYDDLPDRQTADLMMSAWLPEVDAGEAFRDSDPAKALETAINEARDKNNVDIPKYAQAMEFQNATEERQQEMIDNGWDEGLVVGGAVGGGLTGAGVGASIGAITGPGALLTGAVGGAIGTVIGGVGSFLNRDELTEQAARASEIYSLAKEEQSQGAALATGLKEWAGVGMQLTSPLTQLSHGAVELTGDNEVGDSKSGYYAVDDKGESTRPAWARPLGFGAAVGDGLAQFLNPMNRAIYMTQMGSSVAGSVGQLALSGGETFDARQGGFDNIFSDDEGNFDPGSAAAGILNIGIDAVQMAGIGALARGTRLNAEAAARGAVAERAAGMKFTRNEVTGELEKKWTLALLAPSEQVAAATARRDARVTALKEGRAVTVDDFYRAATNLSNGSRQLKAAMVNGFAEGYEEVAQSLFEPWSHDASPVADEVIDSFLMGMAGGIGMSLGATARAPGSDLQMKNQAYVLRTIRDGGLEMSAEEWDREWASLTDTEKRIATTRSAADVTAFKAMLDSWAEQSTASLTATDTDAAKAYDAKTKQFELELKSGQVRVDTFHVITGLLDAGRVNRRGEPTRNTGKGEALEASARTVADLLNNRNEGLTLQVAALQDRLASLQAQDQAQPGVTEQVAKAQALLEEVTNIQAVGRSLFPQLDAELRAINEPGIDGATMRRRVNATNKWLEDLFMRRRIVPDVLDENGVPLGLDQATLDNAAAQWVSLLHSREPKLDSGSFHLILPRVSLELADAQADNVLMPNTDLLEAIGGDFDGDKMRSEFQVALPWERFVEARSGQHFVGAHEGVDIAVRNFDTQLDQALQAGLDAGPSNLRDSARATRKRIRFAIRDRYGSLMSPEQLARVFKAFDKALKAGDGSARKVMMDQLAKEASGNILEQGRNDLNNEWLWISKVVRANLEEFQTSHRKTRASDLKRPSDAVDAEVIDTPEGTQRAKMRAVDDAQTLSIFLAGNDLFRKIQKIHYSAYNAKVLAAEGVEPAVAQEMIEYYAELSRSVTRSEIEATGAGDSTTGRVLAMLDRIVAAAMQDDQLAGKFDPQTARTILANIKVADVWVENGRAVMDTANELSLGQMLLKRVLAQERVEHDRTWEGDTALQAKHNRLRPMTVSNKVAGATNAEHAYIEIFAAVPFQESLGTVTGNLAAQTTPEQWLTLYRSMDSDTRKAFERSFTGHPSYLERKETTNLPYSLVEAADRKISPYHSMLDSLMAVGRSELTFNEDATYANADTALGGRIGEASQRQIQGFYLGYNRLISALDIYRETTNRRSNKRLSRVELMQQMFNENALQGRQILDLIPDAAVNQVYEMRGDQLVLAPWLYQALTESTQEKALMAYWVGLARAQWIGTLHQMREGNEEDMKFNRINSRFQRLLYQLNTEPGRFSIERLFGKMDEFDDLNKFFLWLNKEPGFRAFDQAPFVPFFDSVAEFEGLGAGSVDSTEADLRDAITTFQSAADQILQTVAFREGNHATNRGYINKLKDYRSDPVKYAQHRPLNELFEKMVQVSQQLPRGFSPTAMLELSDAATSLFAHGHDKGKVPTPYVGLGEFQATMDAYDYVPAWERAMESVTSHSIASIRNNLGDLARHRGRAMDTDGNPVEWAPLDADAMLELLDNEETQAFGMVMLSPMALDTINGKLIERHYFEPTLESLLNEGNFKALYDLKGDGGFSRASKYLSLIDARARAEGGHFDVVRYVNSLVIAWKTGFGWEAKDKDEQELKVMATIVAAENIQMLGKILASPESRNNGTLDRLRKTGLKKLHEKYRARTAPGFIDEKTGKVVDLWIESMEVDARTKLLEEKDEILAKYSGGEADKRIAKAQAKYDANQSLYDLLKQDPKVNQVESTWRITGDPKQDEVVQAQLTAYVRTQASFPGRAPESALLYNQLMRHIHAGTKPPKNFDWDQLSRSVMGLVLADDTMRVAAHVQIPAFEMPNKFSTHLKYIDQAQAFLVTDLYDETTPIAAAAVWMHQMSDQSVSDVPSTNEQSRVLNRILETYPLGVVTPGAAQAQVRAQQNIDTAGVEPQTKMAGNGPKRQAQLAASVRRTWEDPGSALLTTTVFQANQVFGIPTETIRVTPTGAPAEIDMPIGQLDNRFFASVKINDVDYPMRRENLGFTHDEVTGGYRYIALKRLRRVLKREARNLGIALEDMKVEVSFFHPDSKPADPSMRNNGYFDGMEHADAPSAAQGLIHSLWFDNGGQIWEETQRSLKAKKKALRAIQPFVRVDEGELAAAEEHWNVRRDMPAMLRAKTAMLMAYDVGWGPVPDSYYNSTYKHMALAHIVVGRIDGKPVALTSDEVTAQLLADPQAPLTMGGVEIQEPRLVVLDPDTVRTIAGDTGDQSVFGTWDDQFDLNPDLTPAFQTISQTAVDRFGEGWLKDAKDPAQTSLKNVTHARTLKVRAMTSYTEQQRRRQSLITLDLRAANILALRNKHMTADEAFESYYNVVIEAMGNVKKQKNRFAFQDHGIPIAPDNFESTEHTGRMLQSLYRVANGRDFARGFRIFDQGAPDYPGGILTVEALEAPRGEEHYMARGDLGMLDVSTFEPPGRDLETSIRRLERALKAIVESGATVAVVASQGGGTELMYAASQYLEKNYYTPVGGARNLWEPVELAVGTQNERAYESTLTETGRITTLNYAVHALMLDPVGIDENGFVVNPRSAKLKDRRRFDVLIPTSKYPHFNAMQDDNLDYGLYTRTLAKLRGISNPRAAERKTLVRLAGPDVQGALTMDAALDRLHDRLNTSSRLMFKVGDTIEVGDIIPLIHLDGRIIFHRYGLESVDARDLDAAFEASDMGVAVTKGKVDGLLNANRGTIVDIDNRAKYGRQFGIESDLQLLGNKYVLEGSGFKGVAAPAKKRSLLEKMLGQDLLPNGTVIDGIYDYASAANKEAFEGVVHNYRNALSFYQWDFMPDLVDFFFPNKKKRPASATAIVTELLDQLGRDLSLKIPRPESHAFAQTRQELVSHLAGFASDLGATVDPGWTDRLMQKDATSGIATAVLMYAMTENTDVRDVLRSAGFSHPKANLSREVQARKVPGLFAGLLDQGIDSAVHTELIKRFDKQLSGVFGKTGYALNPDWTISFFPNKKEAVQFYLQFAQTVSSGDNPVANEEAHDPGTRGPASPHNIKVASSTIGGVTAHSLMEKSRKFADSFRRKDKDGNPRVGYDAGDMWNDLTEMPTTIDSSAAGWRREAPLETLERAIARDKIVGLYHPLSRAKFSQPESDDYDLTVVQILSEMKMVGYDPLIVDTWIRQHLGRAYGLDQENNDVSEIPGKYVVETARKILTSVKQNQIPTGGGFIPLMDVNHLTEAYRANMNRAPGDKWAPMMADGRQAVSWEDWVDAAFDAAWIMPLEELDNGEVSEPRFDRKWLTEVDGIMHGYQNATQATRYLPVSSSQLRNRQLMDPENNKMLLSVSGDQNELVRNPAVFNAAKATIDEILGHGRTYETGREGVADIESAMGYHRKRMERWHRETGAPTSTVTTMRGLQREGENFIAKTTTTSSIARMFFNLRVGNAMFNLGLMASAPVEAAYNRTIDSFADLIVGEGLGRAGGAAISLSERMEDTKMGALAQALGFTPTYTGDQYRRVQDSVAASSTHSTFKEMIYKELAFNYPSIPGIGKVEKWLESYAKFGARLQDPAWGLLPKDLSLIYYKTAMRHISRAPTGSNIYSVETFLTEMARDDTWLQREDPEVHAQAIAAIAEVRSVKSNILSEMTRGVVDPIASHGGFAWNTAGNMLKITLAFQNFFTGSAIRMMGLQGPADLAAAHFDGRKKGKLVRRFQAALKGEPFKPGEDEFYDMAEVLQSYDLADAFIRGGVSHTALFAFGMMAGGLGLSGEDDEEKWRKRQAQLQGAAAIEDPLAMQNDFRNRDAIFLDWLPFGLDNMFKVDPKDPNSRAIAQMNWITRYFASPALGMERFFETGDFSEVISGFGDALGSHPVVGSQLWSETMKTVADLHSNANEAVEAGDEVAGGHLLITAVSVMERMVLENSMVNAIYVGTDRYDRDPGVLIRLDSDGNPQVDVRGNPTETDALRSYKADDGEIQQGYIERDPWGTQLRTLTENRFGLATLGSLFTGVTGGGFFSSDMYRQNMAVKERKVELLPQDTEVLERGLLEAFKAGGAQPLLTEAEAAQKLKNEWQARGEYWDAAEIEQLAKALVAQQTTAENFAAMSFINDAGREQLTTEGAKAIVNGMAAGLLDPELSSALSGIYMDQKMRDTIRDEITTDLLQEGVDLGLTQDQATWRMRRIMFGTGMPEGTISLASLIYTDQIEWRDTLKYSQLNTTYVPGPNGYPMATGFTRDGIGGALGIKPVNRMWNAEDMGMGIDARGNAVDQVVGINTGLRALEPREDGWEIPTTEEAIKAAADQIEEAIKGLDLTPSNSYDPKSSGSGWRNFGGWGGGGGGGGGGYSGPRVYFEQMRDLPNIRTPYANNIPFINTTNPIIRRADVRRERVWSERGRLKQWQ